MPAAETVQFEDLVCQLHDMLAPEAEGAYTIRWVLPGAWVYVSGWGTSRAVRAGAGGGERLHDHLGVDWVHVGGGEFWKGDGRVEGRGGCRPWVAARTPGRYVHPPGRAEGSAASPPLPTSLWKDAAVWPRAT
eukprot:353633-Chlamydomonas_euryale.AAC.3